MMKKIKLKNEFIRIEKSNFLKIALVAIACLPLIYAGLYLWAFWDPYSRIDQLPVAVVNEDKGGNKDGEYQNVGQELVDTLHDNRVMAWSFVDRQIAMNGITSKKYYAAIIIPDTLTTSVLSLDSSDPHQGKITFVTRDATNMLATKIADRVFLELKVSLNKSISEEAVEKIFFKIRDIRDSLNEAVDGTSTLVDGLNKLTDGSHTLHDALTDIYGGTKDLKNGLSTLKDNNGKLVQGSHDAATASATIRDNLNSASTGSAALVSGLAQVSGGMTTLAAGLSQAASGSSQLYLGSQSLSSGLTQTASSAATLAGGTQGTLALLKSFQASHPELATDSGLLTIITTAEQTASGASQLVGGLNQLVPGSTSVTVGLSALSQQLAIANNGSQSLLAGANKSLIGSQSLNQGVIALSAGAGVLANGASTLETGVHDYTDGVTKAKDGSDKLTDGADKVQSGSQELTNNLITAKDGSVELHTKLFDGYQKLIDQTTDRQINLKKPVVATPVTSELVNLGEVANYGTGFTPYFIPLALWVGSMAIFFIIRPIEISKVMPWGTWVIVISKQMSAYVIGLLQSAMLIGVLMLGLGLKVKYLGLFFCFVALFSLTAITIIQCLTAIMGESAKFIAIILLMMQLTSSAGTYPVETAPHLFSVIGHWLPMTYAVSGLREIISGDNLGLIRYDGIVLFGITIGAYLITGLTRKWWKQPVVLGDHS